MRLGLAGSGRRSSTGDVDDGELVVKRLHLEEASLGVASVRMRVNPVINCEVSLVIQHRIPQARVL